MLRLKRNKKEITFTLTKRSVLDRTLFFALFYSLAIHLIVLFVFRIKMLQVDEQQQSAPIAVVIERETGTAAHSAYAQETSMYAPLITDSIVDDHRLLFDQKNQRYFTNTAFSHIADNVLESSFSDEALYRSSKEIPHTIRAYPIKVKCCSNLKALKIAEDGSQLFKEKENAQFLAHSPNRKRIEYLVEVDGQTGKIMRASKPYELLDKKLARLANRLIDMIRFLPQDNKIYKGSLYITFYCTGEEIQEFLINLDD